MDNEELDKILKEKLKNQISPSKEFEDKIQKTIKEQKDKKATPKLQKYKKMKYILSIAAVALIAVVVGISLNSKVNFEENIINVATITDIKPTKSQNEVLDRESEFLIYAEGENLSVESVQKVLYLEPALEYTIEKTSNENEYKLAFKQNIPDNTIVKLQYVKDKITQDSWAYQTADELSVNKTYPYNKSTHLSNNTIIEIEFSYASVENIQNNIEITPAINGTWEHLGKVWRFTPQNSLVDGKYNVVVKSGIVAGEKTLKNDYEFQFTVGQNMSSEYIYKTISMDGINTYKPDEPVRIFCESTNGSAKLNISKIEIAKFGTQEDFIEYLENKNYQKAVNQGKYKFEQTDKYVQLNNSLQKGYYVAIVYGQNNQEIFNCPIQINELAAYAIETERDVLVWVANGENLAQDVQVEYKGDTTKTDSQGLAEFKNVADGSEKVKYLAIGNSANKLVVGIFNYNLDNYPSGYLYTDRPLYKNTDTINVWGFVPTELFYDEIEEEFYIELNSEGKQKIKVEENGNLNYSIELNNHIDNEYAVITLYYKDNIIASRYIAIQNYEAQNYTYEILYNKNYVYNGGNFEFDVKVNHITGLVVPNKTVTAKYNDNIYRIASDENGLAHFSIAVKIEESLNSNPDYEEVTVYNGDLEEYNEYDDYIGFYVINKDTYTNIKIDNDKYVATLYKLANNKDLEVEYNLKSLYDGVYNTSVDIKLEENISTRVLWGYKYNEYTKENEPQYGYVSSKNTYNIKTINTENGCVNVDKTELILKESNQQQYYSYYLIFLYKDQSGRTVEDRQYIWLDNSNYYRETSEIGYYYDGMNYEIGGSNDLIGYLSGNINLNSYYTYRYFLKNTVSDFSIGDTVNFTFAESIQAGDKDIKNEGKILKLVFQEDIYQKDIIENNDITHTFGKDDFPGCKITTAYFYKGNFYRMPIYYFDFDEQDRNVDIEITTDKEKYEPGDEVTLTVKTTNNGNPIKSFVNISVANEAVFKLAENTTNLIENIYRDKNYPVYTYSSYIDNLEIIGGGGAGGGDGEPRANFGDTAYFETIYTDANGIATVNFKLPDNVTTYRVTAHCANEDLYLGVNTTNIVSTLDFFIQYTEPRNVKTSDDLVLNATSIADEKYNVEYEFTIKELNKTLTTSGNTNSMATVNFGKLPFGSYHVVITGKYGELVDSVEYQINIIESAQEVKAKTTVEITDGVTINPSKNPIVLEIYNKNMNQYLKYIDFIESTVTTRLDTQIANNEVQKIKDRYYNTKTKVNTINMSEYNVYPYLKNLPNADKDIVLTSLVSYYAEGYYERQSQIFNKMDNLFETYLYAAANNEPVLLDLLHLKDEENISNYNKLLVTLSLEFLGDFPNARELYNSIVLTAEEANEYKSIIAIIETFINKEDAVIKINELIENSPADEYVRFAILSFFENNSVEIEAESEIKVTGTNIDENVKINGMQVKRLTINNEDLSIIKFETDSKEMEVSYYYQTLLDNIETENISKDINISITRDMKKGNTVTLIVDFTNQFEGPVRIALPNSLRLAQNYTYKINQKYYLQNNQIDYATFFKNKECSRMEIPLLVTYEGNYKFENIVCNIDGIYHISNSIDLQIDK